MTTLSEKPLNSNGGSADVSHQAHERPRHERHFHETDIVMSPALCTNGQERASAARLPIENNHGSLQSRYEANKEPAKSSVVEENFAGPDDAANPGSKGVRVSYLEGGLAPISDGVWPSLEPEYLISSRDNLRGPRTMIKILVLIVSIFTVPIAYYLWMGGWDPILRGSTEFVSFDSKSIMPQPMPSTEDFLPAPRRSSDGILPRRSEHIVPPPRPPTEDETSTRQGGDHGTPAKDGSRTAKFSAGETVAVLQPGTPGAQDLASSTAARAFVGRTASQSDDAPRPGKPELQTAKFSAGETVAVLQPGTPGAQDLASSTAARAFDLPKPSTREGRTASQNDDAPRPGKPELQTAKSSGDDTVTMLQTRTPAAQDSPSSPVLRALDSEQIKLLMKQGEQFVAAGDVVTARIAFQRAAEAGNAKAAVALGATYDPTALAKLGVVGISADVEQARSWYQRAEKLGSPEAKQRLEVLVKMERGPGR
jgi:hypothetical protein